MDNVERAQEALHRVLMEIDWAAPESRPGGNHRVFFAGRDALVSDVILGIERDSQLFLLLANFTPEADASRRADLAGRVHRANWDLMLGNFEMDEASGAVRYRCGVHFGDDELTEAVIRRAIVTAMGLIEAHSGTIRVSTTGMTT